MGCRRLHTAARRLRRITVIRLEDDAPVERGLAAARVDPAQLPRRALREALRVARVVEPEDEYWVAF